MNNNSSRFEKLLFNYFLIYTNLRIHGRAAGTGLVCLAKAGPHITKKWSDKPDRFLWPSHAYVATVPLNYNIILHAWCHTVFHMLIAKICRGIYISTRRDVALPRVLFTQDEEFTHDGNMTFL